MPPEPILNDSAKDYVLFVGDDFDIVSLVQIYFLAHGFRIAWAKEPFELLKQQLPDLIVVVAQTATLNYCYEVIRGLRSDLGTIHIPIVFLAGEEAMSKQRAYRIVALELGADDYIDSPFDLEELRLRVRNKLLLAKRQRSTTGRPDVKPRLLVVEDDFDLSNMLRIYFTGQGYEVTVTPRGGWALQLCRQAPFDIITLDIMLPDLDGYAVFQELRTDPQTKNIPIIFLTQKDERSDKIAGLELGGDDYITKPFDIEELKLRVQAAIKRQLKTSAADAPLNLPGRPNTEPPPRTLGNAELRDRLNRFFNENELRDLCFDLGMDYESLPDQTKAGKARELVAYFERRGDLNRLIDRCRELRPKFFNPGRFEETNL